jgi:hypothetical protein
MANKNKEDLKLLFQNGDTPDQNAFGDLIDSCFYNSLSGEFTSSTSEVLSGIRDALSVPSKNVFDQKNSLPAPNISFKGLTTIQCLSGSFGSNDINLSNEPITIDNTPSLLVSDFSQEFLNNNQIFIEMVIFNKRKNANNSENISKKTGFLISNGTTTKPWGDKFWNRSGVNNYLRDKNITRHNHLPISNLNESINLGICLNNHFVKSSIPYKNNNNSEITIELMVPTKHYRDRISRKYPYSRTYRPLYIAFRYIQWLPNLNNGKGQIISGPLSKTIQVKNHIHPFWIYPFSSTSDHLTVKRIHPEFAPLRFKCSYC